MTPQRLDEIEAAAATATLKVQPRPVTASDAKG
jgi:hypothetical protein